MGMIAKMYDEDKERSRIMGLVMGGIGTSFFLFKISPQDGDHLKLNLSGIFCSQNSNLYKVC